MSAYRSFRVFFFSAFSIAAVAILFVPRGSTQPSPKPENEDELKGIAEWSIFITVRDVGRAHGREGEGLVIKTKSGRSDIRSAEGTAPLAAKGALAQFADALPPDARAQMEKMGIKLPTPQPGVDDLWAWIGAGVGHLKIHRSNSEYNEVNNQTSTDSEEGSGDTPLQCRVDINFTKRTYTLKTDSSTQILPVNFDPLQAVAGKPIEVVSRQDDGNGSVRESRRKENVNLLVKDKALPEKGTELTGRTYKRVNATYHEVTWRIVPKSKLPHLIIERTDDAFLPEPKAKAGIQLRWDHGTPSQIEVSLSNVSQEPGTCLNSSDRTLDPDVEFAPGRAGWTISGKTAATTTSLHQIDLLTHDYAAYGEVSARALFGSIWIEAKTTDNESVVSLVPDKDKNHISDLWQMEYDAENKPADWDEDATPKGPMKKGDGLTLFEEYRGLFVRGGSHQRLAPNRMELVVLDPSNLFDSNAWRIATGVETVFIDDTQHDQQRVNFNSASKGVVPKYALKFVEVGSMTDPAGTANDPTNYGQTDITAGYISTHAVTCRVFINRPKNGLLNVFQPMVDRALADPKSSDGVQLYAEGHTAATLAQVKRALADNAAVDGYVKKMLRWVAIHEACHACGIEHHAPDIHGGARTCPIRNTDPHDQLYIIPMSLVSPSSDITPLGMRQLCTAPDNCWGHLALKP